MSVQTHLTFVVLTWIAFGLMVIRSTLQHRAQDIHHVSGWLQIFLAVMVFTLQGEIVEQAIDPYFANFPVTFTLKYAAMLVWFYLYFRMMKEVTPYPRLYGRLRWVFVVIAIIGCLSIPGLAATPNRSQTRDVLVGIRDSLLLIPNVLVLIPGTYRLWQREQIVGLKFKQLVILICYVMYSVLALGNITKAVLIAAQAGSAQAFADVYTLILIPCAIIFILLLLPYHWLTGLYYPVRYYQCWRVKQVEYQVLQEVKADVLWEPFPARMVTMADLELLIYRAIINILDYGRMLDPQRHPDMLHLVQAAVQHRTHYSELVHQLVRVRL
ncbi:MAG: hypothetical protein OHK0046_52310 [Anaerolineae bacterium]